MYALVVRFDVWPDSLHEFDTLVRDTVSRIGEREPGTLVYGVHVVPEHPTARIFYELYADREAFEAHEREPHTQRFLAARAPLLTGPPRIEFLDPLGSSSVGLPGPVTP